MVALLAGLIGGALLLGSVLLPWSGSGAGSSISARELGDLALSGTVHAWVSPWLGAAVYVVPAAGALLLIGTGLGGRLGLLVAVAALAGAGLVTVVAVWQVAAKAQLGLGSGAMLALIGLGAGALATVAGSRSAGRTAAPHQAAAAPHHSSAQS